MERQEADYLILIGDRYKWMFLDDNHVDETINCKGYLSYRHIICYALFRIIKGNKKNIFSNINKRIEQSRIALREFTDDLEMKKEHSSKGDFLDILVHRTDEMDISELIIIDKTHGCYPLVLNSKRKHEFREALKEIGGKFDKVSSLLAKYYEWTPGLEKELKSIWDVPAKKEPHNN